MEEAVVLKVENISKSYPGVKAIQNVSLTIKRGEVRALLGENGAGKSTLIKCIMGVERPEEGTITIKCGDEWKKPQNVAESKACGMHANYQHVNIAKELSIAENYFLGRLPKTRLRTVDWELMNKESKKIIDKFEMNVNPKAKISELSVAMQEMVTISKISVNEDIRLVVFDEPTALLENDKVEILYKYIRELKKQGVSIIYISHRMEELMEICDTVTVLKDGQYVDTKNIADVNKDMLVSLMVGREVGDLYNISRQKKGKELLSVRNLSAKGKFSNVNFELHQGEILGFAGLVGAGRSEIMRAIFGVDIIDSGEIYIKGNLERIKNPQDAIHKGIGFLTEDRHADGLALPLSVRVNTNMYSYDLISKAGIIDQKAESERTEEYKERIGIKTPNIQQQVENLSGGNQQKVVIAKLLCRNPDILIFDEPTVGVDVGAKQEIYKIMEMFAAQGKGIILISSYLPEVMGLSDKMVVMAEGKISGILNREEIEITTEEDVLRLASAMD